MESDHCYEAFRNSPLAAELSADQCALLAKHVVCRNLKDGEVLLKEGDKDQNLYVIANGNLAVTRNTGGGDWIVLHILRPRDLAGELGFLDGLEHSATLRSIGPTDVYSLDRGNLEALLDTDPRLVYQVMRSVIRSVHSTLRRMNAQYVEMTNYISKQHGRY
jgi:CRP/FNR family transcriptional regulator, cyclic AMP receptor protein